MADFTPTQVYYARSSRNPNYFYTITRDAAGHLDCSCPDRMYRGNQFCKHARMVVWGQLAPARLKGTTVPSSPTVEPTIVGTLPMGNTLPNGNMTPMGVMGTIVPSPARVTTTVVSDLFSDGGEAITRRVQ